MGKTGIHKPFSKNQSPSITMKDHPEYSRNTLMDFIKLKPKDIEICDVTLRDGEQAAGIAFTEQEKIDIARKLDDVGVEIIEAGFPVVSKEELTTIRNITKLGLNARICCLARAKTSDVDAALDANVDIVSIFIATSDIHLRYKHHMTIDEATDCAIDVVDYAKDHGLAVRFAAEDATRTDMDVLKRVYQIAEAHNADYLSIGNRKHDRCCGDRGNTASCHG
jgi:methanogen homocitrate synthase